MITINHNSNSNVNTLFQMVCFLILASSLSGCDAIYRMLDKEGAEEKKLVGEVLPFEKNATIEEVQMLLELYGYNVGGADGMLGLQTRNGIERFQKDRGLKVTRFVDSETWSKLKIYKDKGFIKDGKIDPITVQTALSAAGLSFGKIDGKMGPKTLKAVKKFQEQNNLKVDGKIGYSTLTALSEYVQ